MYLTITATTNASGEIRRLLFGASFVRRANLPWGTVWAICTEVSATRITIALLSGANANANRRHIAGFQPSPVSDYSYVVNGYTSAALAALFADALAGRSVNAESALTHVSEWDITLRCVTCDPDDDLLVYQLFCPLGYKVVPKFIQDRDPLPMRGVAPTYEVQLIGRQRIQDMLSHLYVLLPVLDARGSHLLQWDARKLRSFGNRWLPAHPDRELIAQRLLRPGGRLRAGSTNKPVIGEQSTHTEHHGDRLNGVLRAATEIHARSFADVGCGDGTLLELALQHPEFESVIGVDISQVALVRARRRLGGYLAPPNARLSLAQNSALVRDSRLQGLDFISLVEVIEHLEPSQLDAMERAMFGFARPRRIAITTPNYEYNRLWANQPKRHHDHRFEWRRADCLAWTSHILEKYGYTSQLLGLGPVHPDYGPLTHLIVLDRIDETLHEFGSRLYVGAKHSAAPQPLGVSTRSATTQVQLVDSPTAARNISSDTEDARFDVDIDDILHTRGSFNVPSRQKTSTATKVANAFETLGKSGVDPRWLVYLPPFLIAPTQSQTFHEQLAMSYLVCGQPCSVCNGHHPGRHCIVVLCRTEEVASERFGIPVGLGALGACYSPAGRPIFDTQTESNILRNLAAQFEQSGVWRRIQSDWVCFEARLSYHALAGDDPACGPHDGSLASSSEEGIVRELARMFFTDSYETVGASARPPDATRGPNAVYAYEMLRTIAVTAGTAVLGPSIQDVTMALQSSAKPARGLRQLLQQLGSDQNKLAIMETGCRRFGESVRQATGIHIALERLLATEGNVHLRQAPTWHRSMLSGIPEDGLVEPSCASMGLDAYQQETGPSDRRLLALFREMKVLALPIWRRSGSVRKAAHSGAASDGLWREGGQYEAIRTSLLRQQSLGEEALTLFVRRSPTSHVFRANCAIVANRAV